jgi:SOS-response transcriptional repressor LexA
MPGEYINAMITQRIREKLQTLLDARGISMRQLSLRAGLAHNAVANIMSRNQKIDYGSLEKVLKVLGVALADFWEAPGGETIQPAVSAPAGTRISAAPVSSVLVPDCGAVAAGPFRLPDPDTTQHFYAGAREDAGAFVLTIQGSSMEPEYRNGEMIFLKRENIHLISLPRGVRVGVPYDRVQHLNGKDCVLLMKDEGSTFKRLKIAKGRGGEYTVTLLPVNPDHDKTVVRPDHDVWIQGVCYKSVRRR